MSRGGSADRSIEARSRAAAKGWVSRKRRAGTQPAHPAPGSQQDRVLTGAGITALLDRIRARAAAGDVS